VLLALPVLLFLSALPVLLSGLALHLPVLLARD
jgi:hypothetical protein